MLRKRTVAWFLLAMVGLLLSCSGWGGDGTVDWHRTEQRQAWSRWAIATSVKARHDPHLEVGPGS